MALTDQSPLNLVLGTANVGDKADPMARFDSPDELRAYLDTFAARGHRQLDTARIYPAHAPGTAEPRIGAVAAGDTFSIDTKFNSFTPGSHSKQNILKNIDESLEALGVKQINIEYLHGADRTTDFAEACEAMDQAFKEGKIRHWGLCKHTADEVQRMIDICEERGLIKPSVYQGQYNPVVRGCEKELLSVLRRNGMAFYAYSPAAAGFFAGNHKNIKPGGRYDQSHFLGGLYSQMYLKPSIMAATDKALEAASKHGIGGHAAALRWTVHHGALGREHGDSVILGASSPAQMASNLDMIDQGPLPEDVVAALEAIYDEIGDAVSYDL